MFVLEILDSITSLVANVKTEEGSGFHAPKSFDSLLCSKRYNKRERQ